MGKNNIVIIPRHGEDNEDCDKSTVDLDNLNTDGQDILFPNNKKIPVYQNLVLSGGSIKGISQIGAIKYLVDEKILDLTKIKAVAGSSAGCITAVLIVLGFTPDEIWDFIYQLDFKKLVNPNIGMFLEKCGIESGKIIYRLIEEILATKTGIKQINFKQLYEITKIHLTIVGSCLTTKETIYYDYRNTPSFSVSLALRISIGMPGFFTPVTINNKKYLDGAVMNNYPMNLFKDQLNKTLGILIYSNYDTNYRYPEEYFMAVFNLFMYNYYHKNIRKYSENTVLIKEVPNNLSIFSFNIDNKTKTQLFQSGIKAAQQFHTMLLAKDTERPSPKSVHSSSSHN